MNFISIYLHCFLYPWITMLCMYIIVCEPFPMTKRPTNDSKLLLIKKIKVRKQIMSGEDDTPHSWNSMPNLVKESSVGDNNLKPSIKNNLYIDPSNKTATIKHSSHHTLIGLGFRDLSVKTAYNVMLVTEGSINNNSFVLNQIDKPSPTRLFNFKQIPLNKSASRPNLFDRLQYDFNTSKYKPHISNIIPDASTNETSVHQMLNNVIYRGANSSPQINRSSLYNSQLPQFATHKSNDNTDISHLSKKFQIQYNTDSINNTNIVALKNADKHSNRNKKRVNPLSPLLPSLISDTPLSPFFANIMNNVMHRISKRSVRSHYYTNNVSSNNSPRSPYHDHLTIHKIEKCRSNEGEYSCPSLTSDRRIVCVEEKSICDGKYDCPLGEDEDGIACLFRKTSIFPFF
ncbi:uncharacterized protein LOC135923568 isoform X2 [Gordionus sp. m RMFG-2023]|uniref:uncharacterized protein LOC135923568 isoform X2 n=1 Tax=Gordionus sp. m RMFG-2023 TaxID=3053472 RepID=UPI0031FDD47F